MGTSKKQNQQKLTTTLSKFRPIWPVLLLVVVWLVFCYPYFSKGLMPFPSQYLVSFFNPWTNYHGMAYKNGAMPDIITQIYPWKKITIDTLKNGMLPTWNPYQFSGNPHLANVQSAVFTPLNLLFFVMPFMDAWSLLVLLQPLLASLFMFLFLRSLDLNKYAAVLGSIAFMFCSFLVTWMAYGTLGYALLFLPLFLYGIERFIVKRDLLAIALLIICPPLSVFSGHFQTSLYVLILAFSYLFMRNFSLKKRTNIWKATLYIGIGVLIASLQIIPTYRFYSQSVRSESYIQGEAIPWNQLVRMVAPDFYGNPVTGNDWVGHYAEWGTYAGVIPFVLALFALLRSQKNIVILFFGGILAISILFSFQPQLISMLAWSKIPVLSTSTPSRIVGIISLCIAVLSAFGLNFLLWDWQHNKISKQLIATASTCGAGIIIIWLAIFTMNGDPVSIAKRNFFLPSLLFVVSASILFIGFIRVKYLPIILSILLIILTSFEMVRFSSKWMPFEPREFVYPKEAPLAYLTENANENRVYGLVGNEVFTMFGLYGIEGYDPLYSKRYGEFISTANEGRITVPARSTVVFPRTGQYAKQMLDILGVKYIIHSRGDGQGSWVFPFWSYPDDFIQVFKDDKYEIQENKSAFPRAYLVNTYKKIIDGQQIIDEIFSGETDIREVVILEEEPNNARELSNCQVVNPAELVVIEKYMATEIKISTKSSCNGLVVISDVYYPGWVAYVDGRREQIYRANYTFRAIPVPNGEHSVVLKYENWYL